MVVGPKELKDIIEKEDQPKMEQLEARIDACLKDTFTGQGNVYIGSQLFSDIRPLLVNTVLDKYRAVGWAVQYHSDQRDGDCYTFTSNTPLTTDEKAKRRSRRDHECTPKLEYAPRFVEGYLDR